MSTTILLNDGKFPVREPMAYVPRVNQGGNFCGHDPQKPLLNTLNPIKIGKGGLPRVLTLCMERLDGYYERPSKVLPTLNAANGSTRQQRSERREACIRLLKALLKKLELASLRVGTPTAEGFMNYTVDYVARDTAMTLKRVERALADLKKAGLITVAQQRELKEDGTWKGMAAVKAISKHLFGALGLTKMLMLERGKAAKRLKKHTKKESRAHQVEPSSSNPTERARGQIAFGMITNAFGVKAKRPERTSEDLVLDVNARKRLANLMIELKLKYPDKTAEQIRLEAQNQLGNE